MAEQIYHALLTLQRRGIVRRVHDHADRRAYWALSHSHNADIHTVPKAETHNKENPP